MDGEPAVPHLLDGGLHPQQQGPVQVLIRQPAQLLHPVVGGGAQQLLPPVGEHPAHQPGPDGEGKSLGARSAAGQVQQPIPLRHGEGAGRAGGVNGLRRARPVPGFQGTDKIAPLLLGVEIALRHQLAVRVLHGGHRHFQMAGQGPLGGQLLPRSQGPVPNILLDTAAQIII